MACEVWQHGRFYNEAAKKFESESKHLKKMYPKERLNSDYSVGALLRGQGQKSGKAISKARDGTLHCKSEEAEYRKDLQTYWD